MRNELLLLLFTFQTQLSWISCPFSCSSSPLLTTWLLKMSPSSLVPTRAHQNNPPPPLPLFLDHVVAGLSSPLLTTTCHHCIFHWRRLPLWSSGQSSWLQNGGVLCFLWSTNWIYVMWKKVDRLCGLVVRIPGYRTEMYCVSCEVRTEFMQKKVDRLCGIVVSGPCYNFRGPGSILCLTRFSEK
jgi:hypothetical protein